MALHSKGTPLPWEEIVKYKDEIKRVGVRQFLNLLQNSKERDGDPLMYGDEIEHTLVKFDHKNQKAYLSLRAGDICHPLEERIGDGSWRSEYADYMVESSPAEPFQGVESLAKVEDNMLARDKEPLDLLEQDEACLSFTAFPRLGCEDFSRPHYDPTPNAGLLHSIFLPEEVVFRGSQNMRFITKNALDRRGHRFTINIPIFKDTDTPSPFTEDLARLGADQEQLLAAKPDHVYMDSQGFGPGLCGLHVTVQTRNITEARYLYDQLASISPVLLALTAATPIMRGYLVDTDCRWSAEEQGLDDRSDEERGVKPLNNVYKFRVNKPRWSTIVMYLSPEAQKFNDIEVLHDPEHFKTLKEHGVDDILALHMAHLFIWDPILVFQEAIHQKDEETGHFELALTNALKTLRFKPPMPNQNCGWRVEFRTCELQMTAFENASLVTFVVLLTRILLHHKLDLVIPISKMDENNDIAQRRDAVRKEKLWFRKNWLQTESGNGVTDGVDLNDYLTKLTLNEIVNGKEGGFPGLVPLMHQYLDTLDLAIDAKKTILRHLKLQQKRASGEIKTEAAWIRDFVRNHQDYKHDSRVTEKITYDLLSTIDKLAKKKAICPEMGIE